MKMMFRNENESVLEKQDIAALPPPLPFTSKQIHLPLELIFEIGKSLELPDYRNFLQALWPKNDVNHIDPQRLWKLTTHEFTTTFCNGKKLRVEYNFDPWREEDERILINVHDMLPLFHGVLPSDVGEFTSISKLVNVARTSVHMDACSDHQYASCRCHLKNDEDQMMDGPFVKPEVGDCENGHFHHYCSEHLADWFKYFLATSVLLRETGKCCDEETAKAFLIILMYISYVQQANVQDLPLTDLLP
ncbi:repeat element 27 [Diadegma semiclausum ichnovirus]|nr:repeat element 27 [Diadegma semiclausum ichnovirus]